MGGFAVELSSHWRENQTRTHSGTRGSLSTTTPTRQKNAQSASNGDRSATGYTEKWKKPSMANTQLRSQRTASRERTARRAPPPNTATARTGAGEGFLLFPWGARAACFNRQMNNTQRTGVVIGCLWTDQPAPRWFPSAPGCSLGHPVQLCLPPARHPHAPLSQLDTEPPGVGRATLPSAAPSWP